MPAKKKSDNGSRGMSSTGKEVKWNTPQTTRSTSAQQSRNKEVVKERQIKKLVNSGPSGRDKLENKLKSAAVGGGLAKAAIMGTHALGKKVVHGSPNQNLKSVDPRTGSAGRPNENVTFSWDPKQFPNKGKMADMAKEYANKREGQTGSIYVGKVKRQDIVNAKDKEPWVVSKGKIKVTKEIKLSQTKDAAKDVRKSFPIRDTTNAKKIIEQRNLKKLQKKWAKEPPIA